MNSIRVIKNTFAQIQTMVSECSTLHHLPFCQLIKKLYHKVQHDQKSTPAVKSSHDFSRENNKDPDLFNFDGGKNASARKDCDLTKIPFPQLSDDSIENTNLISQQIFAVFNHFEPKLESFSPYQHLFRLNQIITEQKEKIQGLSTIFDQSFDGFDSLIQFVENFREILPNIQEINSKSHCFFKQEDSLCLKIKSLTRHILLYLNQYDQCKIHQFKCLYQLFGVGVKSEFPLSPNAFILFISSISDKILQLHEKSRRQETTERSKLKQIMEREKIIYSNSLLF
jgi:hypothetical protein